MISHLLSFSLLSYVICSYAEFAPVAQPTPCDTPNRNTLVERFFNTIFTEFYSSPPVCVCVQMCPGQSTYCYPNGCFKSSSFTNDTEAKTESVLPPVMQRNKNNFMLIKDERDFMADFLEQNYVDELKETTNTHNPVQDLLPDVFKSKYNIIGKYKKIPTVDLRHNLQDKVKKDLVKTENEWTKTRWPLSRQNKRNGPTLFSHIDKPLRKQGTYFAAMLRNDGDGDVPEYSSKYFKRELTKTADEDERNVKAFYRLESTFNMTDSKVFSLDTLIDNLIKNGVSTNTEASTVNAIADKNETEIEIQASIGKHGINTTSVVNETTSVISMNFTNENVDKNKYLDISQANKTANLSVMITHLANQIEIQNNTSMEIAKKTIKGFDVESIIKNDDKTERNTTTVSVDIKTPHTTTFVKNTTETNINAKVIKTTETDSETTFPTELTVTKKNRQKVVKKSGSSKIN